MQVRVEQLKARPVCVVAHHGPLEAIDATRRPLYRHMILNELVGGPSIVRFLPEPRGAHAVDALVVTQLGFEGDEACTVEMLPAGAYAVADYEGPESGLATARQTLRDWVRTNGHTVGPVLQVHHMDAMEGIVEEQLQMFLG